MLHKKHLFAKSRKFPQSVYTVIDYFKIHLIFTSISFSSAWRFPVSWPFPDDFLEPVPTIGNLDPTSSMINGWKAHISSYLSNDNVRVLELGTTNIFSQNLVADATFLNISLSALSGPANSTSIPRVTSSTSVIFPYSQDSFDYVILSSGIEALYNPGDTLREAWRVLKPGGMCFICFSTKPVLGIQTPVKMWTTMNDEQKIWIAGSYYEYSVGVENGGGFELVEGFDLLNTTGSGDMVFETAKGNESAFLVQSVKVKVPDISKDSYGFIYTKLLGLRHMTIEDKKFNALRIDADVTKSSDSEKSKIISAIFNFESIYEILKEVKNSVFPPSIKAMLASLLLTSWQNNDEQKKALRRALSLDTPDDYFWLPISTATAQISPRDKVYLIASLVPYFGVDDEKILLVPNLLSSLLKILNEKSELSVADKQLVATEFIICDYLGGTQEPTNLVDRLLRYVQQVSERDLNSILKSRKEVWPAAIPDTKK